MKEKMATTTSSSSDQEKPATAALPSVRLDVPRHDYASLSAGEGKILRWGNNVSDFEHEWLDSD